MKIGILKNQPIKIELDFLSAKYALVEEKIKPSLAMTSANEEIEFYKGIYTLIKEGRLFTVTGWMKFVWWPIPHIKFSGRPEMGKDLWFPNRDKTKILINGNELGKAISCPLFG
mgnify:CR=1 FL=1